MLKNREVVFKVEKTKKVSKDEHGRFLYYTGKIIVGLVSVTVYLEMILTMSNVSSITQAREIIEDVGVDEWYNFGSKKYLTNYNVPEELRILREGIWSFNMWQ